MAHNWTIWMAHKIISSTIVTLKMVMVNGKSMPPSAASEAELDKQQYPGGRRRDHNEPKHRRRLGEPDGDTQGDRHHQQRAGRVLGDSGEYQTQEHRGDEKPGGRPARRSPESLFLAEMVRPFRCQRSVTALVSRSWSPVVVSVSHIPGLAGHIPNLVRPDAQT